MEVRDERAQASVEAAIVLPCLMTLALLALQPACLLYTTAVMEAAAAETARVVATSMPGGEDGSEAFALRRLAAVPDVAIFHAGGASAWDVQVASGDGAVRVTVEGSVQPLPVLGAFVPLFGDADGHGNVRLRVEVERSAAPGWVEGGYDDWVGMWE